MTKNQEFVIAIDKSCDEFVTIASRYVVSKTLKKRNIEKIANLIRNNLLCRIGKLSCKSYQKDVLEFDIV